MSRSSTRTALLALAIALGGCAKGNTYLLLRLDSSASRSVSRFIVDLTRGATHASAVFTPVAPVTLPPEQQLSLTLADHPTGDIDVTVTAENGAGGTSTASGSVHIAGAGTTELSLSFGGDVIGGNNDLGGTTPPDLFGTAPAASFTVTPSLTAVTEYQPLTLHMVALNGSGQPETGYQGTATLSSSWGDVTPTTQPVFHDGVCDIAVSLNRETHAGFAGAVITAADGAATGKTGEITVTIGDWKVDGTAVRLKRTYMKSGMIIAEGLHPGSVTVAPSGGYLLSTDTTIHMGTPAANPSLMIWSSPDGIDWTQGFGTLFGLSDSSAGLSATSITWDGTQYRALYTANDGTTTHLDGASSPDGKTWTAETPVAGTSVQCGATQLALLYGYGAYKRIQGSSGYTCTTDGTGATTLLQNLSTTGAPWAGYVKDGSVHKLWAINGGSTYYYTSSDGINWIISPTVFATPVYAIYWNKQRKLLEGFIDQDSSQSYYRAYRN